MSDDTLTTLADWPEGSIEARAILAGDEVFTRGPMRDFGDGRMRHQVFIKPKGWTPVRGGLLRPIPQTATIYFVGPTDGPVKIGYTANITLRLRDLRLANAAPLMLWASVCGSPSIERAYHRRFAAHRLHGEWFTRCPEIEAEIARLNATPTAPASLSFAKGVGNG